MVEKEQIKQSKPSVTSEEKGTVNSTNKGITDTESVALTPSRGKTEYCKRSCCF